jgi:hypothetical protein
LNLLTYEELSELVEAHFLLSTNFKTVTAYGLQAITTSETSRELLHLYVTYLRPKHLTAASDLLFVSLDGKSVRVGRYITGFFKRVSHLTLSTTTIRSIVATETSVLSISGQITPEQTKSSISMGGHSAITCAKFYQKRSRERDVFQSQEVHQKLIKSSAVLDSFIDERGTTAIESMSDGEEEKRVPLVLSDVVPVLLSGAEGQSPGLTVRSSGSAAPIGFVAATSASNIGIAHPCYLFEGRRITWTKIEVHHVGTWCKAYEEEFPAAQNVVAKCLDSILKDKKVREHFHPHHLMDSSRLRWGWKKFLDQENNSNSD